MIRGFEDGLPDLSCVLEIAEPQWGEAGLFPNTVVTWSRLGHVGVRRLAFYALQVNT